MYDFEVFRNHNVVDISMDFHKKFSSSIFRNGLTARYQCLLEFEGLEDQKAFDPRREFLHQLSIRTFDEDQLHASCRLNSKASEIRKFKTLDETS